MHTLRLVTRKSPLALWQAEFVRRRLMEQHSGLGVELVGVTTLGDRVLDSPLAKIGGKGVFIKELEQALLNGEADLAVHSMKDVTLDFPPGLCLPAIMEREDPRDAFVAGAFDGFASLPPGARVGTSSLRRRCQVLAHRPDLDVRDLRGNVGTRLAKLDAGEYDAIILAAAGLLRLGLKERIRSVIGPELILPAIGQGAVGIECRAADTRVLELLAPLAHRETTICVLAERAMNRRLGGACQVPIAGHARLDGDRLQLAARVGRTDGSELLEASISGHAAQAEPLGIAVAEDLLRQGADAILAALLSEAAGD